jgi:IS1 family transposase
MSHRYVLRVIVWLNGAFGVGKTSTAQELVRLLPDARLVDPERIGFVIRRTFWRRGDYQDVRLWRRLTNMQVATAAKSRTAVVPMTVVRADIRDQITKKSRVVLLTASRAVLEERIVRSSEATE